MKVAISTDQGYVSAHFGRCQSYTIVEIKEGQVLSTGEIPNQSSVCRDRSLKLSKS